MDGSIRKLVVGYSFSFYSGMVMKVAFKDGRYKLDELSFGAHGQDFEHYDYPPEIAKYYF
ncbi:hypothetical protein ACN3E9_06780 [Vibrio pectenicida]|uniref:hypothetical protein n=1 Tax=Vibrio pectenicida TaxID=62763 RepID=UPI003B9C0F07